MDNEVRMIQCLIHWAMPIHVDMRFEKHAKETSAVSRKSTNEIRNRTERIFFMKPSTDDKAIGTLHEVKGAIKQKAGELTHDRELEADGDLEKNEGKVQHFVGKVEKIAGV
jgi:uncharacterized protein YjbJ (UPF0337 family)